MTYWSAFALLDPWILVVQSVWGGFGCANLRAAAPSAFLFYAPSFVLVLENRQRTRVSSAKRGRRRFVFKHAFGPHIRRCLRYVCVSRALAPGWRSSVCAAVVQMPTASKHQVPLQFCVSLNQSTLLHKSHQAYICTSGDGPPASPAAGWPTHPCRLSHSLTNRTRPSVSL